MTTTEPIQPQATDTELQQHKTAVSNGETDRDLLVSLFDMLPAVGADVAAGFTSGPDPVDKIEDVRQTD
jgi:hypothetical protein